MGIGSGPRCHAAGVSESAAGAGPRRAGGQPGAVAGAAAASWRRPLPPSIATGTTPHGTGKLHIFKNLQIHEELC